jgi:bifunctional non-homologous end joining protein LigD
LIAALVVMKNAPLVEYKQKRDFAVTQEPRPRVAKSDHNPIFVIQEHHASRLHYDFRLEADGVLKSWAVPKKPTTDPAVRRLAVQVEDHPLGYANFSGKIPEGEYGAGTVKIWDRGTYENLLEKNPQRRTLTQAIADGHVEILLRGRKLSGKFALVRTKVRRNKSDWLLIKMKDIEAPRKSRLKKSESKVERRRDSKSKAKNKQAAKESSKFFEFTNEDKIIFPQLGATKGDVLRYYERIAGRLLPHLENRPMTLERLPDGLRKGGPHFWQKNTPSHYPSWVPRIMIKSGDGEPVEYPLVNDVKTLLYLVNQGALTFHPWFSRVGSLDRPDFVLFDLDPGKAPFANVVRAAKMIHRELTRESVECYVKTSGKSGLHVLALWQSDGGYEEAREWADRVGERIVELLPESVTLERSKTKRKGRVYLDVMQNVRGHHAVGPYVLRAVPEATISTPLKWNELSSKLDPRNFNLETIFRRLAKLRTDPLAPLIRRYKGHD